VKAADAGDRTRSIDQRLAELEADSRAAAQLTQEMAQQIHALALANASATRQARLAVGLGVIALLVAIAGAIGAWT
jgi:hypothetical protein